MSRSHRDQGHKFTSFCNYSMVPSLNKVYYYYYYYYYCTLLTLKILILHNQCLRFLLGRLKYQEGGGGLNKVHYGRGENGKLPTKQHGTNWCLRFISRNFEILLFSSIRLAGRHQVEQSVWSFKGLNLKGFYSIAPQLWTSGISTYSGQRWPSNLAYPPTF